jgi:hypothetical protein
MGNHRVDLTGPHTAAQYCRRLTTSPSYKLAIERWIDDRVNIFDNWIDGRY